MVIPVFDELKSLLRASALPERYVSHRSGVSRTTLRKWMVTEEVFSPRIDTMMKVAMVLGLHVALTPSLSKLVNFYPKPKISPPPIIRIGLSSRALHKTLDRLQ